jgi:hypothetical protein
VSAELDFEAIDRLVELANGAYPLSQKKGAVEQLRIHAPHLVQMFGKGNWWERTGWPALTREHYREFRELDAAWEKHFATYTPEAKREYLERVERQTERRVRECILAMNREQLDELGRELDQLERAEHGL